MLKKLLLAVGCVSLGLAVAGDNDRLVNDRDVRYGGEELDESNVAMSCRMGAWVDEWESKGIFKNEDYVLFRTKDEGVEVLVAKAKKGLWDAMRQQKSGTEMTLYGKVHWAKGIDPYVVIHEWKKGFTQPYEPRKPVAETIVLTFGGKAYDLERGKSYTLVTPKGEKVEARWDEK